MTILQVYVDDQTHKCLQIIAEREGRSVEDLAEAAVAEACVRQPTEWQAAGVAPKLAPDEFTVMGRMTSAPEGRFVQKGKFNNHSTPDMWFAMGHSGKVIQRRPEGWTLLEPGRPNAVIAPHNLTVGAAKTALDAFLAEATDDCGG